MHSHLTRNGLIAKTVKLLLKEGLIGGEGKGLQGKSWLKNRLVGEVVGRGFNGSSKP
jgi:hypothetical protein